MRAFPQGNAIEDTGHLSLGKILYIPLVDKLLCEPQVAMYRFSGSATGGFKLEVVSLGLYSLDCRAEDVLACHDHTWGKAVATCVLLQHLSVSLLILNHPALIHHLGSIPASDYMGDSRLSQRPISRSVSLSKVNGTNCSRSANESA